MALRARSISRPEDVLISTTVRYSSERLHQVGRPCVRILCASTSLRLLLLLVVPTARYFQRAQHARPGSFSFRHVTKMPSPIVEP